MKKIVLACLSVILGSTLQAQLSSGGTPWSVQLGLKDNYVSVQADELDMAQIEQDDATRSSEGELPLYSRFVPLNLSVHDHGTWKTLSNGDRIGRLEISSKGALATELYFDDFFIPTGGSVFIYSPDKSQILGSFGAVNNKESGQFSNALIYGESSIVEFYEPANVVGQGRSHIHQLGHAYRMLPGYDTKADPCQVDVNCSEGSAWHAQRDGVVRIRVVGATGAGWCTGTVVNNTNADCKPYILSAWHCGDASSAVHFQNYLFYFRFQRAGCGTGVALTNLVLNGCVKIADSEISASNDGSDFLLLELDTSIPDSFTPFFAGWDISGSNTPSGVSIHQPNGDEKKISTFTTSLNNATWQGSPNGWHWRVIWSGTANGHGVTEGGSSGSGIFNSDGLIIGTLTGGASFCNDVQPGGKFQPDFYGKMDKHWEDNGSTPNHQLKPWLDPNNTGVTQLVGSHDPCGQYSTYTGIDELEEEVANLYPNPVSTLLNYEFSREMNVRNYRIVDLSGSTVLTGSTSAMESGRGVINVEPLSTGMYVLSFVTAEGRVISTRFAKGQ